MKYNEYREELRQALLNANLDADTILEKYDRRIELAKEAGFSEEEAVDKFGSIDDIVESYLYANKKDIESRKLNIAVGRGEVLIKFVEGSNISYQVSEKYIDDYKIENNKEEFSFQPRTAKFESHKNITYRFYIGKDVNLSKVRISSMSADIIVKGGELKADSIVFETVSGDINIEDMSSRGKIGFGSISGDILVLSLKSDQLSLSTVSGDLTIKQAVAKQCTISTVSGDVTISGSITSIKSSSVSGDVIYNDNLVSPSLTKRVSNIFKRG